MLVLVKNNSMTNCAEVHRTRSLSVLQKDVVLLRGSVRLYPRSGVQWVWLTPVMLLGKLVNQGEEWIREVSRGWSHWHRAHEAQLLKCSQSGLPLRWLWRLTHCFFSVDSAHFQDYFWKTGRWKCHRGIEKIWRAAAIRAAFAHVWGSKRLGWLWQHSPGELWGAAAPVTPRRLCLWSQWAALSALQGAPALPQRAQLGKHKRQHLQGAQAHWELWEPCLYHEKIDLGMSCPYIRVHMMTSKISSLQKISCLRGQLPALLKTFQSLNSSLGCASPAQGPVPQVVTQSMQLLISSGALSASDQMLRSSQVARLIKSFSMTEWLSFLESMAHRY